MRFKTPNGLSSAGASGQWTIMRKRLVLFDNSGVYGRFDSNGLRKRFWTPANCRAMR